MKLYLMAAVAAVFASTSFASAGGLDAEIAVNSASQAVAQSQSRAVSVAQGGNVTFNTPASQHIENSGTTTIRSAPQVVAPSMSSGHPCAYAPISVGVSVIGFGGAFGGQRIDDACLLAQMQVRDAAMVMIATRNPAACRALEATGHLAPGACGGRRNYAAAAPVQQAVYRPARPARPAAAPARPAPVAARPVQHAGTTTIPRGSVTCVRKNGRVVQIQRWPNVSDATARQYCRQ